MIGYVYLTINDVNNICYIGKRQKARFDRAYRGSGKHLKLALAKYGRDKFHAYILEWCETKEALCKAEKKWIAKFKSIGAELYNIAEGGEGGNMVDWSTLPAERRKAINEKNRLSHLGTNNAFYGRHHSEKTKALLRAKNSDRKCPKELQDYKQRQRDKLPKIKQIDKKTGETVAIWNNWCEAGRAMVTSHRMGYIHISQCCKGCRKTAYGYRWEVA